MPFRLAGLPWRLAACLLLLEVQGGGASVAVVCGGLETQTVTVSVRGDQSDAFQYKKTGITYSGSSGEIYMGRSAYHGNVVSALRFVGVPVPRGARVASARARLVDAHAGDVCCNGEDMMVLVRLERAPDSTPLPRHHTPGWLLSRLPTTGAATWLPEPTDTFNATHTPELAEMVQAVVSLEAWAAGNAMTLLMDGEGENNDVDERVYFGSAVSFPQHRAALEITYCEPPAAASHTTEPPPAEIAPVCPPAPKCEECPFHGMPSDSVVVMASAATQAAGAPRFSARSAAAVAITLLAVGAVTALAAGTVRRRRGFIAGDEDIERCLDDRSENDKSDKDQDQAE